MIDITTKSLCRFAFVSLLLCGGCTEDDTTPDAAKPAQDAAVSGNDAATKADAGRATQRLFGGFVVKFIAAVPAAGSSSAKPASTSVIGKLLDAESPEAIIWELADQAQGCELRTPRVPFCDPDCGGVAICVEDDECTDIPTAQDVGAVEVSGVGPAPFSMKFVASNYQYPGSSSLAYPPCDEGEAIEVHSEAGAYDALALHASCVTPLSAADGVAITTGKPLALAWTAPNDAGLTRIHIKLDISHHGGEKGFIECDVADTGSFAIPQQLVQQLVDLGVAGFPSVLLSRVSVGNGDTPLTRDVSLTVSSSVLREVEIPGLTSCEDDSQCEDGQTCQSDATCK